MISTNDKIILSLQNNSMYQDLFFAIIKMLRAKTLFLITVLLALSILVYDYAEKFVEDKLSFDFCVVT